MRTGYIIAILLSVGIFNSCSGIFVNHKQVTDENYYTQSYPVKDNVYGTYLAARMAHIRQDYNTAADYYIKSINLGANDSELLSKIYLLLSSESRIDEAAIYAKKALEEGDKNNFISFTLLVDAVKNNQYSQAYNYAQSVTDKAYKDAIAPLLNAWIFAGQNNKEKALASLELLKKDKGLLSFYYMHRGMINDYFKDSESAQQDFEAIINNENLEISFRSLQIISDFYIRNSQEKLAHDLILKYYNKNKQARMLKDLLKATQQIDNKKIKPMIDTPQKGLSEAVFNIGTVFRNYQNDIAQIFTAYALYLNPDNDAATVSLANLLEAAGRETDAIKRYKSISKESPLYFMANLKASSIYIEQHKTDEAINELKKLYKEYPNDYNVMFNLGEVSRMNGDNSEAIKYYNLALNNLPESMEGDWTVYYALGIAYERNNQWQKAEQTLQQALKISNRHPYILNYLGYTWLEHNKNYNEALYMIFEAYQQNPESGHIMDSLGWALYRMGKYDEAISVLEKAAEYLPANAIVCDHLGDVYWVSGRKSEAKHQWQHALTLKEDAENLDKNLIRNKIKNGIDKPSAIIFNEALLIERLKTLNTSE